MSRTVRQFSIFLSSPNDLEHERATVKDVCAEINLDRGRLDNFVVDLVDWETHVHPTGGPSAQSSINGQIGLEYDIYLGMLGSRFGTPTDKWGSGTEEEFRRAYQEYQRAGKPEILFYFADKQVSLRKIDAEQFVKVSNFRDEIHKLGVLSGQFTDEANLKTQLHRHLSQILHVLLSEDNTGGSEEVEENDALDPLANWHALIANDPILTTENLANRSVEQMAEFTRHLVSLTDSVKRLSHNLNKDTKRLNNANNRGDARQLIAAMEAACATMRSYIKGLRVKIPQLYEAFSDSMLNWPLFRPDTWA